MKISNLLNGILYEVNEFKNAIINRYERYTCQSSIRTLSISVTNKCNSKCRMCNIWKTYVENPSLASEELALSDFQRLFSDREFFKELEFVYISGGEPFLRTDLPEIVGYIHECQPQCTVYIATNGFLKDCIIDKVRNILTMHPKVQIGVSIDGTNEMHDYIRRVPGAFNKAKDTIISLRQSFPNLHIQGTMTVTSSNIKHIPLVYDFCKKNGLFPQISLATLSPYFLGSDVNTGYSPEEMEELKKHIDEIRKDTIRERGRFSSLSQLFWLEGSLLHLLNPKKHLVPCYSGFNSAYIDPYGAVFPCYSFFEEMGNIKKEKMQSIWCSEKAKKVRRHILENKCPNCWIAHEASISIKCDYFRKFKYMLK